VSSQEIPVGAKVRWVNGMGEECTATIHERKEKFIYLQRGMGYNKVGELPLDSLMKMAKNFEVVEPILVNKDEFKKRLAEEIEFLIGRKAAFSVIVKKTMERLLK
jgi:hypothetical protein